MIVQAAPPGPLLGKWPGLPPCATGCSVDQRISSHTASSDPALHLEEETGDKRGHALSRSHGKRKPDRMVLRLLCPDP